VKQRARTLGQNLFPRWFKRATLVPLALLILRCGGFGPGFTDADCYPLEFRAFDTSCATATVEWETSGSAFQDGHEVAELPWSRALIFCEGNVSVRARRGCDDNGITTVEIWFDQNLQERGTAEGANALAQATCWVD
jgi:hypothetical protein